MWQTRPDPLPGMAVSEIFRNSSRVALFSRSLPVWQKCFWIVDTMSTNKPRFPILTLDEISPKDLIVGRAYIIEHRKHMRPTELGVFRQIFPDNINVEFDKIKTSMAAVRRADEWFFHNIPWNSKNLMNALPFANFKGGNRSRRNRSRRNRSHRSRSHRRS